MNASTIISRAIATQLIAGFLLKFFRCKYPIASSAIVRTILAITTRAYVVCQADLKSKRTHAFALPLITTAIALQSARTLKRGTAIMRSFESMKISAKIPPTHSANPTT
jgi:putative effector of murein hydrolase